MRYLVHCARALILGVFGCTAVHAQTVPSVSCLFETFLQIHHDSGTAPGRAEIRQSMKVVAGKTVDETLSLDGRQRATNSERWIYLPRRTDLETVETSLAGDFGEILTVAHALGANRLPLSGWYKASLVSPGVDVTHIMTGNCFFE